MKLLIAVYTNRCKDYCAREFYKSLMELAGNHDIIIVDNSSDSSHAVELMWVARSANVEVVHIDVPAEPERTRFLRNVALSANRCREKFLQGDYDHMLVIESDVIPPVDLIPRLKETMVKLNMITNGATLNLKPWGIVGAIYYMGVHDYNLQGIHPAEHVLSGCTLYKGELLRKYPFRWSEDNLNAFPDAWISQDTREEYSLWNNHDIICDHLFAGDGSRNSRPE